MKADDFIYDIDEYGNKIYYHMTNPNQSFLTTAKELKIKGIRKYYFMLRINNPLIADYDPHNPNLSPQIRRAILEECAHNIWYFMSRVIRLKTNKGNVPFYLHRGLCAAAWCFEHSQDFLLTEPRQTYKTTGIISSMIQWAYQFTQNTTIHMIGKATDNTIKNLSDLKDDIILLPKWMQFKEFHTDLGKVKKSKEATRVISNKYNIVKTFPKANSIIAATNIGRGDSAPIIYYDEVEHTLFFPEIFRNTAFAYREASAGAEAVGKPHCRILTGTPGNMNTSIAREVMPLLDSMIPWTEQLYDMTSKQIIEYKSSYMENFDEANEGGEDGKSAINVLRMEYDYKQLRKTDEWVEEQRKMVGDKAPVKREVLLIRGASTDNSPISPEDIEYLTAHKVRSDKELIIQDKWLFKIYYHDQTALDQSLYFNPNIPYLVGIDPSTGAGKDNFAITIINPWNMKIAAEFKNKYLSGPAACDLLNELVAHFIPKAVLIPEKNSIGAFLIQMLLKTPARDNVYWSEKSTNKQLDAIAEENYRDRELRLASQLYSKYGVVTSNSSRNAMFSLLFQYIDECKYLLNTEYLVDDICKLVRTATGKVEAEKGSHDDNLMSYLLAIYIYHTGDNLEYFGVDKRADPLANENHPIESLPINFNAINRASRSNFIAEIQPVKSFDQEVIEDQIRQEANIKKICQKISFVQDPLYNRNYNLNNRNVDETVDIPPSFFYNINRR